MFYNDQENGRKEVGKTQTTSQTDTHQENYIFKTNIHVFYPRDMTGRKLDTRHMILNYPMIMNFHPSLPPRESDSCISQYK